MTHTPGPWKAQRIPGDNSRWEVRDSNGKSITGWGCVSQTRENARLIAAAPDMLAALEVARKAIQSLSADALGTGGTDRYQWYLRDELLSNIDKALAAPLAPHEDAGLTAGEQHLAIKAMRENMGEQDNG